MSLASDNLHVPPGSERLMPFISEADLNALSRIAASSGVTVADLIREGVSALVAEPGNFQGEPRAVAIPKKDAEAIRQLARNQHSSLSDIISRAIAWRIARG